MDNYEVLWYELFIAPDKPTESGGEYYCRAETIEEADSIARINIKNGLPLYIKAVCSDGRSRIVL